MNKLHKSCFTVVVLAGALWAQEMPVAEPTVAQPAGIEAFVADPVAEPSLVEPTVAQVTDSAAVDSVAAEPAVVEPAVVEPVVAEPAPVEPVAAKPEKKAVTTHESAAPVAQEFSASLFRIGTHTGIGISGFNNHNQEDLGFFLSGSVGISALIELPLSGIPVLNGLQLAPELNYTLYTATMDETVGDEYFSDTETMDVSIHAVELPVLLRYTLPGLPLFAEVGPQVGVIVSSNTDHSIKSDDSPDVDLDISGETENLNRFMLGATAGIGYLINTRTSVDVRYHYGARVYSDGTNGHPYNLMLGVNYLF